MKAPGNKEVVFITNRTLDGANSLLHDTITGTTTVGISYTNQLFSSIATISSLKVPEIIMVV